MLAAEKRFGESGVDATSLRAICSAAGQRNISCVPYHFGDKYALLRAILEYRENQLEPMRRAKLEEARAQGRLGDVRTLLRILFEPYARMFLDEGNLDYIKLIAVFTNQIRPRGVVLHPAHYPDRSYPYLHEAMDLLRARLAFLDEQRFDQRADSIGAMFWGAFIQFAARNGDRASGKYAHFEDTLEMMAAAIAAAPYLPRCGARHPAAGTFGAAPVGIICVDAIRPANGSQPAPARRATVARGPDP
jgi:AcrR family transcriptional regulator